VAEDQKHLAVDLEEAEGIGTCIMQTGLPVWARYDPYASAGPVPYAQEYGSEEEINALKEQAQILKEQLEDINVRISALNVKEQQETSEQKEQNK
jgi:hypothetical protein